MQEIIISWQEKGLTKTETIKEIQPSKNPGIVRLGREPSDCDITFSDLSISRLHVEIFYNNQHNKFYLRNLKANNPPMVDNQLVVKDAEVALNHNSLMCLGQTKIKVIYNKTLTSPRTSQPTIASTVLRSTPIPQPSIVPVTQQPEPGPTHLVCPNPNCTNPDPQRLVPIQMNNVGYCPWCGTSLADAGSFIFPKNN